MLMLPKLQKAFSLFDAANKKDPNKEIMDGISYPKEMLYAKRMTDTLNHFTPNASEALQLAARCQHICRWEIPRASYEMNRTGYLTWRHNLKKFHAQKAKEILTEVGYDKKTIAEVVFLLEKKQLKKHKNTQTLEDVICLVFLTHYFEPFTQKYEEEKLIDILQKTWRKMSKKGQKTALELQLSENAMNLLKKALRV